MKQTEQNKIGDDTQTMEPLELCDSVSKIVQQYLNGCVCEREAIEKIAILEHQFKATNSLNGPYGDDLNDN
jgi:hypothetical protein